MRHDHVCCSVFTFCEVVVLGLTILCVERERWYELDRKDMIWERCIKAAGIAFSIMNYRRDGGLNASVKVLSPLSRSSQVTNVCVFVSSPSPADLSQTKALQAPNFELQSRHTNPTTSGSHVRRSQCTLPM